jgi:hypothetical protein
MYNFTVGAVVSDGADVLIPPTLIVVLKPVLSKIT